MGVRKTGKKSTAGKLKSGKLGKAGSLASKVLGRKSGGIGRKRRVTPERLAKQILILKLKKKLWRLKYGSR